MTKYRTRAAALLAAGAVAGGVTAATLSANAADDTGTSSEASRASAGERGPGGPGGPGSHGRGGFGADAAALAKALGVSEDKVSDALDAVREATQPDAKPADGAAPAAPTDQERAEREAAFVTALAKELGLDEAKVSDALETVRAAHEAEHRTELSERLDQAVEDGDLTAADKESVLKAYDAGVLGGR